MKKRDGKILAAGFAILLHLGSCIFCEALFTFVGREPMRNINVNATVD